MFFKILNTFRVASGSQTRQELSPKITAKTIIRCYSAARDHVEAFREILGEGAVLTSRDAVEKYCVDWTKSFRGGGGVICLPRSTMEVSALLKYCHANNVAIVPQGGNTGLVGGAVGKAEEEVCSVERMRNILDIDQDSGVLTCEAGAILQVLENAVAKKGFIVPLDLGSKGSCQIGGNLATNAGGTRVLRYGSMHANVLGLEVVLADGSILNLMSKMKKNNSGLHLKNLFIGSEGSLGVITKVSIQLAPLPISSPVLIARLPAFTHVPSILRLARQQLSDILSAFEFLDMPSLQIIHEVFPNIPSSMQSQVVSIPRHDPLTTATSSSSAREPEAVAGIKGEVLVLLECVSFNASQTSATERLTEFTAPLLEKGIVTDAILSQDLLQQQNMWKLREQVPVALATICSKHGKLFKYDVSLPLGSMSDFVAAVQSRVSKKKGNVLLEFCNFGHAGDQNLHLNIVSRRIVGGDKDGEIARLQTLLDDAVYTEVLTRNGSVSAEHGIGQLKRKLMDKCHEKETLETMISIKKTLDPRGIMNPGKLF